MNIFDKKQEPDLASLLDTLKQSIVYNYNFHRIGVIEEFFTNNQTASVKLVDKKITLKSDGSKEVQEYPLLINCPVLINKNKNGGITIPILKGDFCLICFNDRDIDNWFMTGTIQEPNSTRTHDMSDALIITGLKSSANPIHNYNNNATEINYLQSVISLQQNLITIQSNGLIEISNQSKNLLDILRNLINSIKDLQVQDPQSGSPLGFINTSGLDTAINDLQGLLK